MKPYILRLTKGDDLKVSIQEFVNKNQIKAGYIATCVGCLDQFKFRKADGVSEYFEVSNVEIISLTGTIAENGMHLHIGLIDQHLNNFGGHLLEGCKVNTTAEIVIVELKEYQLKRTYDENTGYKELEVMSHEEYENN